MQYLHVSFDDDGDNVADVQAKRIKVSFPIVSTRGATDHLSIAPHDALIKF